jgi:multiple antibiotic resistance protein
VVFATQKVYTIMLELFLAVLASLFSMVNPLGAIPVFLGMTPHYTKQERTQTALHTSLYFTLILLTFFLAGSLILSFFGISINAMRIAGGLVILLSGYSLMSGKFAEGRAVDKKSETGSADQGRYFLLTNGDAAAFRARVYFLPDQHSG